MSEENMKPARRSGLRRGLAPLLALAAVMAACSGEAPRGMCRREKAFSIGIASPPLGIEAFQQAVSTEVEALNKGGGVLGKKIRVVFEAPGDNLYRARQVAQRFIDDRQIDAVIGHFDSSHALNVARMYGRAGLLQAYPWAFDTRLDALADPHAFILAPSDRALDLRAVAFAKSRGWKRIAFVRTETTFGKDMDSALALAAPGEGVELVYGGVLSTGSDMELLGFEQRAGTVSADVIMVAGRWDVAYRVVAYLRKYGYALPVIHIGYANVAALQGGLGQGVKDLYWLRSFPSTDQCDEIAQGAVEALRFVVEGYRAAGTCELGAFAKAVQGGKACCDGDGKPFALDPGQRRVFSAGPTVMRWTGTAAEPVPFP